MSDVPGYWHAYRNCVGLLEPLGVVESAATVPEIAIADAVPSHLRDLRQYSVLGHPQGVCGWYNR